MDIQKYLGRMWRRQRSSLEQQREANAKAVKNIDSRRGLSAQRLLQAKKNHLRPLEERERTFAPWQGQLEPLREVLSTLSSCMASECSPARPRVPRPLLVTGRGYPDWHHGLFS